MKIFLTGGTGFLGSHIAARCLRDGHEVALLARASEETAAGDRVTRLLDWHGLDGAARSRCRVVEGDLTADGLGLAAAERERLLGETEEIVNAASETAFAERKRGLLERVNVGGLARLLDIASEAGRLSVFHHLSTAYVAGRRDGDCREDWVDPGATSFHNAYEETKCRGERMVRDRCAARGVRAVVYRPSIVCGASRTGRTLLFNALYHPVRAGVFLRDVYLEDIRERGGDRARRAGVSLGSGGVLRMPLRIEAEGPGLDIVPVDFFTDAFMALRAASRADGRTADGPFHIVSGRPTPVADVAAFVTRMFGMDGLRVTGPAEIAATPRNPLESVFERMVEVYRPYMSDRRTFTAERSGPILTRAGLSCPAFTFDVFERCMAYAVAEDWGARAR